MYFIFGSIFVFFYVIWQVWRLGKKVVADEVKTTTYYFGQTHCEYSLKIPGEFTNRNGDKYVDVSREYAYTTPRPSIPFYAPYVDKYGTHKSHKYYCTVPKGLQLPYSYVKEETITWKTKYIPRPPFATHAYFESSEICNNGRSNGALSIGLPVSGANHMTVYETLSNSYKPNSIIYSGAPTNLIGYDHNNSGDSTVHFRVKFDEGSSYYISGDLKGCDKTGKDNPK